MSVTRLSAILAAAAALSACSTVGRVGDAVWPFDGDKPAAAAEPPDGRISILTFEQKLEADESLTGRAPVVPAAVEIANWSQPGGPADNAPPNAAVAGDLSIAWRRDIGDGSDANTRISSPPVIADGRIYIRGWGHLWAIGTK